MKMSDYWFVYKMFDPFYKNCPVEVCEWIRLQYKNDLNKHLIGKTIRFNFGFSPPNNVGVVERIDYSNITPMVHLKNMDFPIFIEFFDTFKYEII